MAAYITRASTHAPEHSPVNSRKRAITKRMYVTGLFKKAMGKKDSEFLSVVVSRLSKGEEESL